MAKNVMKASAEWSSRPESSRFYNPAECIEHLTTLMAPSACKVIGAHDDRRDVKPTLRLGDMRPVLNGANIELAGPSGTAYPMTNWAMAQLCGFAGLPADLIQTRLARHPAEGVRLLDLCMRDSVTDESGKVVTRAEKPIMALIQRTEASGPLHIRSLTGWKYKRIWDIDIMRAMDEVIKAGWKVPLARPIHPDNPKNRPARPEECLDFGGKGGGLTVKAGDMTEPSGVYWDDRSSFILAVNPNKVIDTGADDGGLWQALMVGNSETGGKAFFVRTMLLEAVCGNHILWGVEQDEQTRIIHKGDALTRWREVLAASIVKYEDKREEQMATIQAARAKIIGATDEEVVEELTKVKRFNLSGKAIRAALEIAKMHTAESGADPRSVWGVVEALTRYSQMFPYADQRYTIDKSARELLMSVAA